MTNYRTHIKTLAANKAITAENIIILCAYKALHSKHEDKVSVANALLKRSFSPVTKPSKLAGGAAPYGALARAKARVTYWAKYKPVNLAPIDGDEASAILDILNSVSI